MGSQLMRRLLAGNVIIDALAGWPHGGVAAALSGGRQKGGFGFRAWTKWTRAATGQG